MRRIRRNAVRTGERGYVLVAVAFMVLIVGGISYSFLMSGLAERSSLENAEDTLRALEIAEAGIVRAELELRGQQDPDGDGLGTVTGDFGGGTYNVVAAPYPGDSDRFTLTASATHRLASRRIEVGLRVVRSSRFKVAAFGDKWVKFSGGGKTDAYDSALGSYVSQATNNDGHGAYADTGGSVGSNGSIEVLGAPTIVRGDAVPGPGNSVTGSGTVTGSTAASATVHNVAPVSYEEFVGVMLANDNDLLLGESWYDAATMAVDIKKKGSVTLPPGTFFFSDFTLGNKSDIKITGKTTIYATGDVSLISQSFLNSTGEPANFRLLHQNYALPPGHKPGTKNLKVTSHSAMHLVVYAPDREISVTGGGDIFGALVAQQIKFAGQAGLHYDKALGDEGGNKVTGIQRLYWRDLAQPRR